MEENTVFGMTQLVETSGNNVQPFDHTTFLNNQNDMSSSIPMTHTQSLPPVMRLHLSRWHTFNLPNSTPVEIHAFFYKKHFGPLVGLHVS